MLKDVSIACVLEMRFLKISGSGADADQGGRAETFFELFFTIQQLCDATPRASCGAGMLRAKGGLPAIPCYRAKHFRFKIAPR